MHTKLNLHYILTTVKMFVWQHSKDFATVYAVGREQILSRTSNKTLMFVADVAVA
jgi:hypothetical protein